MPKLKSTARAIATYKEAVNAKNAKVKLKKARQALDLFHKSIKEVSMVPNAQKKKPIIHEYITLLYLMRAEIFFKAGENEASMDEFTRALEVNEHTQQNHDAFLRKVYCHERRALIMSKEGRQRDAEHEIQRAISLARQAKDLKEEFDALEVATEVYGKGGKTENVNSTFQKLLRLAKKLKLKEEKADLYFKYAKFLAESRLEQEIGRIEALLRKAAILSKVQNRRELFTEVLELAGELSARQDVPLDYKAFFQSIKRATKK
ncbi:MAG: hypothetical protein ACTSU5_16900 [Promethearchaeota archaeon]